MKYLGFWASHNFQMIVHDYLRINSFVFMLYNFQMKGLVNAFHHFIQTWFQKLLDYQIICFNPQSQAIVFI